MKQLATVYAAWLLVAGPAMLHGQTTAQAEKLLESARHKEVMDGDLKGAIEQYRKVVAQFAKQPEIAAKALLQMGQCQEKLGHAEARKSYERIVREYGGAQVYASAARARLAAFTTKVTSPGVTLRRVFEDMEGTAIAVSSDGRWVVHLPRPRWEFFIRDNQTGKSRQLSKRQPGDGFFDRNVDVVFSADNRHVAYVRPHQGRQELHVVAVDGSNDRTVFRNRNLAVKGWFPDGQRILIHTRVGDDPPSLYAVSITGGSAMLIKRGEGSKLAAAWMSPDGKLVAYGWATNMDPYTQSIRILNLEDGTDTVVTDHPSVAGVPRFTLHNKGMVFFSNRRGIRDLWYQALSGGRPAGPPQLVKADLGNLQHPIGLTSDGTLYLRARLDLSDAYMGEFDPGSGKWVNPPAKLWAQSAGQTFLPSFSADGRWVAYTRRVMKGPQSNTISIFLRPMAGGKETEIPTEFGFIEWMQLYPQGDAMLIQGVSSADHRFGHYRFDFASRRATFLGAADWDDWAASPSFDKDGRTVYMAVLSARQSRVIAWNTETGAERVLATGERFHGLRLSPDGRSLAFGRREGASGLVEIMATDGGNRRVIHRQSDSPDFYVHGWSGDGRWILFGHPAYGTPDWVGTFQRISVDGGAPQSMGLTARDTEVSGKRVAYPVIHPDGRHIVFDAGYDGEECYALENFQKAAQQ